MKHIKIVSKRAPAKAAVWQEVLCEVAGVVVGLLGAKGGSVPFLTYLDEKCEPNPILES
jgi:hypothetical protein